MKRQTDYVLKGLVIDGQTRKVPFCIKHKCFMGLSSETDTYRRYSCGYGVNNPDLCCGLSVDVDK
jgi:hypothetical protein